MAERTVLTDRFTVVISRQKRWRYEWSVEGPYTGRTRRGVTLTAWGARRLALRFVWSWGAVFERQERIECQIANRRSVVLGDDPDPLPVELLADTDVTGTP